MKDLIDGRKLVKVRLVAQPEEIWEQWYGKSALREYLAAGEKGVARMLKKCFIGLLLAGLMGVMGSGAMAQEKQAFLWDGTHWPQLSFDAKVGFIKGMGNLADFEMASGATGRSACFAGVLVRDLKSKTIGEIVQDIDKFYQENPGKLATPVIEVVMRRCTQLCPPEVAGKGEKK